jgi:hypothetical protein
MLHKVVSPQAVGGEIKWEVSSILMPVIYLVWMNYDITCIIKKQTLYYTTMFKGIVGGWWYMNVKTRWHNSSILCTGNGGRWARVHKTSCKYSKTFVALLTSTPLVIITCTTSVQPLKHATYSPVDPSCWSTYWVWSTQWSVYRWVYKKLSAFIARGRGKWLWNFPIRFVGRINQLWMLPYQDTTIWYNRKVWLSLTHLSAVISKGFNKVVVDWYWQETR